MNNRQLSICIPNFNRRKLLIESFEKVIDDPRVYSVDIWDDGSNEETIYFYATELKHSKISCKLGRKNEGVHKAKRNAVANSQSDWCILFDSDNILDVDYLDTIFSLKWEKDVCEQPSFLKPHFDFRHLAGGIYNKESLPFYLNKPNNKIDTFCNAQNFFINRQSYLDVWEEGNDVNGNDSLYFFYLWAKAGKSLYLCPNLEYYHRVDNHSKEQSGNYNSDNQAGIKIQKTMNLLRNLK